jgi:hypothetical protein
MGHTVFELEQGIILPYIHGYTRLPPAHGGPRRRGPQKMEKFRNPVNESSTVSSTRSDGNNKISREVSTCLPFLASLSPTVRPHWTTVSTSKRIRFHMLYIQVMYDRAKKHEEIIILTLRTPCLILLSLRSLKISLRNLVSHLQHGIHALMTHGSIGWTSAAANSIRQKKKFIRSQPSS